MLRGRIAILPLNRKRGFTPRAAPDQESNSRDEIPGIAGDMALTDKDTCLSSSRYTPQTLRAD